ncbi:hypothetical protein CSIM01_07670 [Colletotrichum simmondsii]|uniref:Nephrocystin 3-like N-terminal domain-containing protein n=1 Tax=Colletotrichum simmondsii TaxID=703756 RepID=A0A135TZY1_9PEZI|nr:hypothetical protein CSIM01_07670 [Colletotrichum simmondsii]
MLEEQREMKLLGQHQSSQISTTSPEQQTRLGRQDLQAVLGVSSHQIEMTLENVRSVSRVEGMTGGDLVKKLAQIQTFRNWMQSNKSEILFLRIHEAGRLITPLSSVCLSLVTSLQDMEPAVTLHYFCGVLREDSAQSRSHLLRSLIVQLLEKLPDERTLAMGIDYALISECDFNALRQLFEITLLYMPGAVISCVIDGCSRYPNEDELQVTLGYLLWACQAQSAVVKLKLLLTSPIPLHISQQIPEGTMVFLPTTARQEWPGLTYGWQPNALFRRQIDGERSGSPPPVLYRNPDDNW